MSYVNVIPFAVVLIGIHSIAVGADVAPVADVQPAETCAHPGASLAVGTPEAFETVRAVILNLSTARADGRAAPLPDGTVFDRAEWGGNVLHIDLTLPAAANTWTVSPFEMESLMSALGGSFIQDTSFAGIVLRVRVGPDGDYRPLRDFTPFVGRKPDAGEPPAEVPIPIGPASPDLADGTRGLGGPISQAARQPTGALTGVTVFVSAGHGWVAIGSDWILQRPLLLEMNEDHGNIDQINYFVHYAFNAGATVVPFRPVGWQDIETVLDQDDPGVTYTGAWSDGISSRYYENGVTTSGVPYKWTSASATETATARYTPDITVTDFYPVYCFVIADANRTLQTYRIKHSGGISEVQVDHRLVGSGWIWLGSYHLQAGGTNYVEITDESTETGTVVADAIRWGNGIGDIVRPGPGTVSGHRRDEEASRYWAHSELGNRSVGFDPLLWDQPGWDDWGDDYALPTRWAAEMNQEPDGGVLVERWKRVHLEFHSNASGGSGTSRGCMALVYTDAPTTYQETFATFIADELDADMVVLEPEFEHSWVDRLVPTYFGSYWSIGTEHNHDEFDATVIEIAFHDNVQDSELLRDARFRAAAGRSCLQGIIRFLNWLPGSTVPLAFAPDPPRNVRVEDLGGGDVKLSWAEPLSDEARGDPATGYVVYASTNGFGFGNPIVLGNVLTTTISGIPAEETRYYRIAATNAGGESMPSEVLAIRRPATGTAPVLIVNGFDRLRRQMNPIHTFTGPPEYAGQSIERQIWRRSNSYDYIVRYAETLGASSVGFASCANEVIIDNNIALDDYDVVVWICGEESTEDYSLSGIEQTRLNVFLNGGGALFLSGSEIAYDLDNQNHGRTFYENTLKSDYVSNDAGTYAATGSPGSILGDIGAFDFDPANGAPYDVDQPDQVNPKPGAVAALTYVGGAGGVAAVQYDVSIYRTVTFGFPFEAITSAQARADIMERVITFLLGTPGPVPFDFDEDGDVGTWDYQTFGYCLVGPTQSYLPGHMCLVHDGDDDSDVDLQDFWMLQEAYTGDLQSRPG